MGGHSGKYDKAPCSNNFIGASDGRTLEVEQTVYSSPKLLVTNSQSFTSPLKEVWESVKDRWEANIGIKSKASSSFIHKEYTGWFLNDPGVDDKKSLEAWIEDSKHVRNSQIVKISPLSAKIVNDIAIVHYNYLWFFVTNSGERYREIGRYSETLMSVNSQWLLISDVGGSIG